MSDLALHGGTPVRDRLLPYGRQSIGQDDIDAVVEVLRSDWLTTGPAVRDFETAFAAYVGAPEGVAVANGTAALHASAAVAGIGPESEVIVPALTFAASANCVRYLGGPVVFADVRPDTLTVDSVAVQQLISPRTRAIVAVDYAGQPADLDDLAALARAHDLVLIEDAAHALGAVYRGRPVGALADLTTFSLHPVKHVTTGEGGVITTSRSEWASALRRFRNHGITSDHRQRESAGSWFYEMVDLGFNYRITDFQCALGASQLRKQAGWLAARRRIAEFYRSALGDLQEVELPSVQSDRQSAWHLYPIRLNLDRLSGGRADVFQALRAENIGVNVHYIPVPWHPYYQRLGYRRGAWPVAEDAYERLISLPMFPAMTDHDIADVCEAIRKVVGYFAAK